MTESENFLGKFLERWSRRKLAATEIAAGPAPRDEWTEQGAAQTMAHPNAADCPTAPLFDPASLPPIESINAASDLRAFLAPGVPIELTRAALRRAWTTDPSIRDFVGIAENQWDFSKPDSVPGFGSLELTPELRRVVANLFGATQHPPVEAAEADQNARMAEMPTELHSQGTPATSGKGSAATAASQPGGDPISVGGNPPGSKEAVPQHSKDDVATQKNIGLADANQRVAQRKHGSAVPE